MNPDTIGCVWTSEFDLNTLRVDGEFLNLERKGCGFKYPDTSGRGLRSSLGVDWLLFQFPECSLHEITLSGASK